MNIKSVEIIAFISGLVVSLIGGLLLVPLFTHNHDHGDHHDNHPIADPFDSEYHVHADFHIVVNDTLVDLSADRFQTTSQQELHQDAHLHDNNGDVKHIHAENVTLVEFFESLSITLTDECITLDNQFCSNSNEQLQLYVNEELYPDPITSYVPVDDDRILVYYGATDNPMIATYLEKVPDDACYYSGTCPERGIAPDENCGLSCEL